MDDPGAPVREAPLGNPFGGSPAALGNTGRGDVVLIEVNDLQRHLTVDREAVAALAREVLTLEGVRSATVSIVLVDNAAIHAINRRELGHDWTTDVITFDLSEPGEGLAGELVVSAEMALAMARSTGGDALDELVLYVVHGLLHLHGFGDGSPEEIAAMRDREAEILASLGRSHPFSTPLACSPLGEEAC